MFIMKTREQEISDHIRTGFVWLNIGMILGGSLVYHLNIKRYKKQKERES